MGTDGWARAHMRIKVRVVDGNTWEGPAKWWPNISDDDLEKIRFSRGPVMFRITVGVLDWERLMFITRVPGFWY